MKKEQAVEAWLARRIKLSQTDREYVRFFINSHTEETLIKYSKFLEECGYLDDDWWCEPPNAVTRFLNEEK